MAHKMRMDEIKAQAVQKAELQVSESDEYEVNKGFPLTQGIW